MPRILVTRIYHRSMYQWRREITIWISVLLWIELRQRFFMQPHYLRSVQYFLVWIKSVYQKIDSLKQHKDTCFYQASSMQVLCSRFSKCIILKWTKVMKVGDPWIKKPTLLCFLDVPSFPCSGFKTSPGCERRGGVGWDGYEEGSCSS